MDAKQMEQELLAARKVIMAVRDWMYGGKYGRKATQAALREYDAIVTPSETAPTAAE